MVKAVLNLTAVICGLLQLVQQFASYGLSLPLLILYILFFVSLFFLLIIWPSLSPLFLLCFVILVLPVATSGCHIRHQLMTLHDLHSFVSPCITKITAFLPVSH